MRNVTISIETRRHQLLNQLIQNISYITNERLSPSFFSPREGAARLREKTKRISNNLIAFHLLSMNVNDFYPL